MITARVEQRATPLGKLGQRIRRVQQGITSTLNSARDLNVKLIDMVQANTEAAFEFAHGLANAK